MKDIKIFIKSLSEEQKCILESYYLQSEIEELHDNYSFEEFLEYCNNNSNNNDNKTILDELLEE